MITTKTALFATILAGVTALPIQSADITQPKQSPLSLQTRTSAFSKYIFRGFTYSETAVVQPTATLSYGPFSVTGLGNYDIYTRQVNEADVSLDLTLPVKKSTFSLGYECITFPNTSLPSTSAAVVGVGYDCIGQPGIRALHDFQEGDGTYLEASLGHSIPLAKKASLSLSATLAYNHHYYRNDSSVSHAVLGVSLPLALTRSLTITPSLNYQHSFDKKDFQNELWGGLAFSYKF